MPFRALGKLVIRFTMHQRIRICCEEVQSAVRPRKGMSDSCGDVFLRLVIEGRIIYLPVSASLHHLDCGQPDAGGCGCFSGCEPGQSCVIRQHGELGQRVLERFVF